MAQIFSSHKYATTMAISLLLVFCYFISHYFHTLPYQNKYLHNSIIITAGVQQEGSVTHCGVELKYLINTTYKLLS